MNSLDSIQTAEQMAAEIVKKEREEDEERLRAKVDKYKTTIRSLTDKVHVDPFLHSHLSLKTSLCRTHLT